MCIFMPPNPNPQMQTSDSSWVCVFELNATIGSKKCQILYSDPLQFLCCELAQWYLFQLLSICFIIFQMIPNFHCSPMKNLEKNEESTIQDQDHWLRSGNCVWTWENVQEIAKGLRQWEIRFSGLMNPRWNFLASVLSITWRKPGTAHLLPYTAPSQQFILFIELSSSSNYSMVCFSAAGATSYKWRRDESQAQRYAGWKPCLECLGPWTGPKVHLST